MLRGMLMILYQEGSVKRPSWVADVHPLSCCIDPRSMCIMNLPLNKLVMLWVNLLLRYLTLLYYLLLPSNLNLHISALIIYILNWLQNPKVWDLDYAMMILLQVLAAKYYYFVYKPFMNLSYLIPILLNLKATIDVYLQLLIDDFKRLWIRKWNIEAVKQQKIVSIFVLSSPKGLVQGK